jgi:hypothetical protein
LWPAGDEVPGPLLLESLDESYRVISPNKVVAGLPARDGRPFGAREPIAGVKPRQMA